MFPSRVAVVLLAAIVAPGVAAQPAAPVPAFDVAYRAWEVVNAIARHNRAPALAGECARTFQPFVVPGLRRQTRPEQDAAATACHASARSACAHPGLQRTADMARQCQEFR